MRRTRRFWWLPALAAIAPGPAAATVIFQNAGVLAGWDRSFTQHAGTNTEVDSPTFQGPTAIRAWQTYKGSDGGNYHAEVETYHAQKQGEDRYYGQAIYVPPEWIFHDQNVTFQQWAPDNDSGSWILMFVFGDKIQYGHHGVGKVDVASITNLRGTWIRLVTRIQMTNPGVLEVWLNGQKVFSVTRNFLPNGPTIRWSTGIYCTLWDTDPPAGLKTQWILHDHLRVASTYEEAEPANWTEDGSPAPAVDAGSAGAGGTGEDPDAAPAADAPTSGGGGAMASGGHSGRGVTATDGPSGSGGTASGGHSGSDTRGGHGGSSGEPEPTTEAPPVRAHSGCTIAAHPPPPVACLLVAIAFLTTTLRRKRH